MRDSEFIRGDVPMTKSEVRSITLQKLELQSDSTFLDIGCGTGSITVEASLECIKGKVYAIDNNIEAVALTTANCKRFGLLNVKILRGEAPCDISDIMFDRIFVGGGGEKLPQIIDWCKSHTKPNGIIVINTILIESTYNALKSLEGEGFFDIECICVNISKGEKFSGWMMKAQNPIYIISARYKED